MPQIPSVLMCIAHGSEAIEVVTFLSLLRRAGISLTVASVDANSALEVSSSDNILLQADEPLCNVADGAFDLLLLPGGTNQNQTFTGSSLLIESIRQFNVTGRYVAAMSNLPSALLDSIDLFSGANMTCLPRLATELAHAQWQERRVVWDPRYNLLTGQGPLCATDMALKIIELLKDKDCAHAITHDLALPIGIYNFQE